MITLEFIWLKYNRDMIRYVVDKKYERINIYTKVFDAHMKT